MKAPLERLAAFVQFGSGAPSLFEPHAGTCPLSEIKSENTAGFHELLAIHSAVGCGVTPNHKIWRRPWHRMSKP
jgi:hypothetical protein